jgi:uncharacterized protein (TIGR04222 family)
MNPFDMRGPAFLAFYVLAGLVGLIFLYLVSRGLFSAPRSPSPAARRHLRDPYLLAFLRGGVRESLQTAAFSLNKRKLLSAVGPSLVATRSKEALQALQNPLEIALMSQCTLSQSFGELLRNSRVRISVENYAEPLRESGLVADDVELRRRLPVFLVVAGTLFALSAVKLYVAVQRGHTNFIFLVILTVIVLVAAVAIFKRRRTNAGDRALTDQQTLFARLKSRASRVELHSATDEDVLVAAAFGLAALPAAAYPFAARLKRQMRNNSSGSSSGCGSSCGGGGCGGGCGGCGS